jgi:glutamine amidotransferase-like uncharacterized protein
MMAKIFIYNGANTGENSCLDAKQLFECEDIFDKRPDVVFNDLKGNFNGLNSIQDNPTLVIPGGSACLMGMDMLGDGQNAKIQELVSQGFHVVGICAGAYLAPTNSDFFKTDYVFDPEYTASTAIENFSFNICATYSALGPFYPNKDYDDYPNKSELKLKNLRPFNVTLSLNETSQKISQLFVEGCGFESQTIPDIGDKKQPYEVVATYADCENYSFSYPSAEQKKTIHNFAAMIRKKAGSHPNEGGVFLSGTHIEACVENSKLLTYFYSGNARRKLNLTDNQYKGLLEGQSAAKETIIPLLKSTFKRI